MQASAGFQERRSEEIKKSINLLIEDMKWIDLFSQKFIDTVSYDLHRGLEYEILKSDVNKFNV